MNGDHELGGKELLTKLDFCKRSIFFRRRFLGFAFFFSKLIKCEKWLTCSRFAADYVVHL